MTCPQNNPDSSGRHVLLINPAVFALQARVYREHYCERRHRTYLTLAKCVFWKAGTITGDGPWAVPSCTWFTISLHDSQEEARETIRFLNQGHCGHRCVGQHRLIFLDIPVGKRLGA